MVPGRESESKECDIRSMLAAKSEYTRETRMLNVEVKLVILSADGLVVTFLAFDIHVRKLTLSLSVLKWHRMGTYGF